MPHSPYSPDLAPRHSFCFPGWKQSSKGNVLQMFVRRRWNKIRQKHYKASKLTNSKAVWSCGKNVLISVLCQIVLWKWLKFKHVRICTQFFIYKFSFKGCPLICLKEIFTELLREHVAGHLCEHLEQMKQKLEQLLWVAVIAGQWDICSWGSG